MSRCWTYAVSRMWMITVYLKILTYLFNDVKVTWIDFELLWIFLIASTICVDVSTDTIDDVDVFVDAEEGLAVDIVELRPVDAEDEGRGDDRIGLLWR